MIDIGSHSQLLQDPEGAYAQLMKLQDVNNYSVNHGSEDQEISTKHATPSSQRTPCRQSASGNHSMEEPSSGIPPEVPLFRLAYLNKPEIPILIMGTIAAITNGVCCLPNL